MALRPLLFLLGVLLGQCHGDSVIHHEQGFLGKLQGSRRLWQAPPTSTQDSGSPVPSPLQGMPYNLEQLPDLAALLAAHKKHQLAVLEARVKGAPAVVCYTGQGHGLGNRVPGVITSFAVALLTGKVWLLDSTLLEYMDFPFAVKWNDHSSLYEGVPSCDEDHFTRLASPELQFCGALGQNHSATVWNFKYRWDYDLPVLQVNPTLKPYFKKFFPSGDVFHQLSTYLFKPKQYVQDAMEPYAELSANCIAGMHMRTKKAGTSAKVEQFAGIAHAIAGTGSGTVFLAADAKVFDAMQSQLPDHRVWWSKITEEGLNTTTQAGNPATELSAIVDFLLLSRCKNIILTPSSSIGGIAAGYAGITPVYATHGHHNEPFYNPWFGRALSSEPCLQKGAVLHRIDTALTRLFKQQHPLWMHHNQCHFDPQVMGWRAPDWECAQGQACREY